ncbi:MAG: LysR family transcriptional regulator [Granulosicoccus sp.]|nr:LysR family transcriptional regulator [Granulosicoccus sp.]
MPRMISDGISLRGLEVLDELSRTGSVQEAAVNLGMSAPAASQQLKNLEAAVGRALVEHNRRPMTLSRSGRAYLNHVQAALMHLRQGAAELMLDDLGSVGSLRIGIIDDFDSEVTPRLTVALADVLMSTVLTLVTAPSLRILEELAAQHIDIGIAAGPQNPWEGVSDIPILRDPFVMAVPRGYFPSVPESIESLACLPFLRYEKSLLLSRQIATHLARLRLTPMGKIELDSNQAIFGLIANGKGWTISTLVGFLRARRYQDQVDLYRLPFTGFSRTISLYYREDWMPEIAGIIANSLRSILQAQVVEPGRAHAPWLGDTLSIVEA